MVKFGVLQGLEHLIEEGLHKSSVTTDRHVSIRKFLRGQKPDIPHKSDSWHVVKGNFHLNLHFFYLF